MSFWYLSELLAFLPVEGGAGEGIASASAAKLSLSMGCRGLPPVFFGALFSFLLTGGVCERMLSSLNAVSSASEFSSSEVGFFLGAVFVILGRVCFFAAAGFATAFDATVLEGAFLVTFWIVVRKVK